MEFINAIEREVFSFHITQGTTLLVSIKIKIQHSSEGNFSEDTKENKYQILTINKS